MKIYLAVLATGWSWFISTALFFLIPIYSKYFLHVRNSVATLILISFFSGSVLGFLINKFAFSKRTPKAICFWIVGLTLALFDIFSVGKPVFAHSFITLGVREFAHYLPGLRISADFFLMGLFNCLVLFRLYYLLSKEVPPPKQHRVFLVGSFTHASFIILAGVLLSVEQVDKNYFLKAFLSLAVLTILWVPLLYPVLKNRST